MDRCRVHVADGVLRVLLAGEAARIVPLDVARASQTLREGVVENESAEGEVDVAFPAGLLDCWLRCVADSAGPAPLHPPTHTLVEYLKACDYFADEHHLWACSAALGRRLFAKEDQQAQEAEEHVVVPEQVLRALHEHLADHVVLSAPADSLDYMLSVLPAARHPHVLRAAFASIAADNSLCLDCEKHPHATLTAALSAAGRMPPLVRHLEVTHIPVPSDSSSGRKTSNLLAALCTACMSPMHVSLSFESVFPQAIVQLIGALSRSTALTRLSMSQRRGMPYFPEIEELTCLERLDSGSYPRGSNSLAGLALLTGLTALRFTGGELHGANAIPTALPALQHLLVFEVTADLDLSECFHDPPQVLHTAIIRAASTLPKLYDLTIAGRGFNHDLDLLQNFRALRRCSIAGICLWAEGLEKIPTPEILSLADSLRNMPKLEDFSLQCEVVCAPCLFPVFDALKAAGTCSACTSLVLYADYFADDPTQVCERIKLLTNLQHLCIPDDDVLACSNLDILEMLAAALHGLTHLDLSYLEGMSDSYEPRDTACEVLLPALRGLKVLKVARCLLPANKISTQIAIAAIISQNSALECLKMQDRLHVVTAQALSSAAQLTELECIVADKERDDSDDDMAMVDWTRAYSEFVQSLGLLTNLRELSLDLDMGSFSDGFGNLPQSLAKLDSLRVVSIERRFCIDDRTKKDLHEQEWARIVKALSKAHALERLTLEGFGDFSDASATCVADSLSALTNLREVVLFPKGYSTVSFNGAKVIARALSTLPKLRESHLRKPFMSLTYPNLTDEEAKVLDAILHRRLHYEKKEDVLFDRDGRL